MVDQIVNDILCNVKNKMKDYFFLKEDTYDKNSIDNKTTELNTAINKKSKVTFSRTLNSGTKIGKITIDDNSPINIYCETNTDTTYTPASNVPLKDSGSGYVGQSIKYAREDHYHPVDISRAASVHTHTKSQITDFPTLSTVATSGSYNDLGSKPTIPSGSTTATDIKMNGTQSAGSSAKFAKADHIHPVDTSRAPSSHTHTKAQITNFPTIPSKTSQLTNDSGFLTSHQDISGKVNIAQGSGNANKNVVTNSSGQITTEAKIPAPSSVQQLSFVNQQMMNGTIKFIQKNGWATVSYYNVKCSETHSGYTPFAQLPIAAATDVDIYAEMNFNNIQNAIIFRISGNYLLGRCIKTNQGEYGSITYPLIGNN